MRRSALYSALAIAIACHGGLRKNGTLRRPKGSVTQKFFWERRPVWHVSFWYSQRHSDSSHSGEIWASLASLAFGEKPAVESLVFSKGLEAKGIGLRIETGPIRHTKLSKASMQLRVLLAIYCILCIISSLFTTSHIAHHLLGVFVRRNGGVTHWRNTWLTSL